MSSKKISRKSLKLSPATFTAHNEVVQCIKELKEKFGDDFEKLLVSDTLDVDNHQYVNLVQKGGGVLGIALVGYTYILEQARIRFLRLAGTSAGAINTAMLAVIGKKEDAKSEKIVEYLCDLNFFNLVDGHPFARWLIKHFIKDNKFEKKIKLWALLIILLFTGFIVCDILFLGLRKYYIWSEYAARISFVLTGFIVAFVCAILFYIIYLLNRLKETGYGVNPGTFFYDWIKSIMESNGVSTVTELNTKAGARIPGLKVRKPQSQSVDSLQGDVTFITSELVSENKIEFPKMTELFRANQNQLHPAQFVRASMSIPIFFESHIISDIPTDNYNVQQAWKEYFGTDVEIPDTARFVDGGMLSDFPINIFYNPKIIEPRLPSFGIDLDDSNPNGERGDNAMNWSIAGYFGRMLNTIRYYYDKDFLIKNNVFKKGIGKIPLHEFNWLNFFLSDDDKIQMFIKGARAATEFLKGFDWNQYQSDRITMQQIINAKYTPEITISNLPPKPLPEREKN